jgi:hypothetical protein
MIRSLAFTTSLLYDHSNFSPRLGRPVAGMKEIRTDKTASFSCKGGGLFVS